MEEPMTPIAEAVAGMHELYVSMIASGFTEAQACQILGVMLAASGQGETERKR